MLITLYGLSLLQINNQNRKAMKKEFQIEKEGATNGKVTIVSKVGMPFDRTAKIQKYIELGYTVYDMDNNIIAE